MVAEIEQDRVRARIADERAQLVDAVTDLRRSLGQTTDLGRRAQEFVVPLAGAALLAGFLLAGGLRGAIHLAALRERKRRERRQRSWLGGLLH